MAKAPFERVFSKIDRKKILQRAIKEKTKIHLKSTKNELIEFRAIRVDDSLNLEGSISGRPPTDFCKVTALFYLANERYFITTRIKKNATGNWVLLSDQQFYRLNRREAFRIQIPVGVELSFYISTVRNIEINRTVQIVEISSGGARIHWDGKRRLSPGGQIRGSLQWGQGKVLPVEALIVHSPGPDLFGLRFIHLNSSSLNRLKILCIEIQMDISSRQ